MNFPEAIAFCALAVLLIVFAGIWLSAYEGRMKHRHKKLELEVRLAEAGTAHKSDTEVARLEERVRVLERIVTDGGYNVATQIEALRDTRRVEELDAGTPLGFEKREKA